MLVMKILKIINLRILIKIIINIKMNKILMIFKMNKINSINKKKNYKMKLFNNPNNNYKIMIYYRMK